MTDDREVVVAITELGGRFDTLATVLQDFVTEQRKCNLDHEARIRTIEGAIRAIEKIGEIEARVGGVEDKVCGIINREAERRGVERAISIGAGVLGGFLAAIVSIAAMIMEWGRP